MSKLFWVIKISGTKITIRIILIIFNRRIVDRFKIRRYKFTNIWWFINEIGRFWLSIIKSKSISFFRLINYKYEKWFIKYA